MWKVISKELSSTVPSRRQMSHFQP
jgi:hypothetical protein